MATPAKTHALRPIPPDPRDIVEVIVRDLLIDRNAQREINHERVAQIAQEFDWLRFEMPTCVALEDGILRVVEGQHRVLALRRRDPDARVRVLVIPGTLALGEESGLALGITTARKPHDALERWDLRVRRGDRHEVEAEEILRQHNLRLGSKASQTTIAAVGLVTDMIHYGTSSPPVGAETLDTVLSVLEEAFPEDKPDSHTHRWNTDLMRAVSMLVVRNPMLNADRLAGVLKDRTAQQWLNTSLAEQAKWRQIGGQLAGRYNKNLRNPKGRISL